jgi:hypothetical protein
MTPHSARDTFGFVTPESLAMVAALFHNMNMQRSNNGNRGICDSAPVVPFHLPRTSD